MKVSNLVVNRLADLLNQRRVVVWYDAERAFGELIASFGIEGDASGLGSVDIVDASHSGFMGRQQADRLFGAMNDANQPDRRGRCLLIYVARPQPTGERERMRDPFESFAVAGATFGASAGESLVALARQALPARIAEIERMFREGRPTLALLDRLDEGENFPLVKSVMGTDNAVEAAALLLADPALHRQLDRAHRGFSSELSRLLRAGLGYAHRALAVTPESFERPLRQYVLLSEFAFDLPEALPASVGDLPRATPEHRHAIYALTDRLRGSDAFRDAYVAMANEVQHGLHLDEAVRGLTSLGQRDTFAFEDDWALSRVIALCGDNKLDEAGLIAEARRRSIWRRQEDRNLRWTVVERALALLRALAAWSARRVSANAPLVDHVRAYTAGEDGLWNVDRAHRELEQAAARCSEEGEQGRVLDRVRLAWRQAVDSAQDNFLRAVEREGWPPSGVQHQTRIWERHVDPALTEGQRVAYFLVDAMRYEMGRALRTALEELGSVSIEATATVVPTTTPFGMAALMPGASGALRAHRKGDELVPAIGARELSTSAARMDWIAERLGTQFVHITLDELVDASQRRRVEQKIRAARLVVVKTQDIDELGEGRLLRARREITNALMDLPIALQRLAELGVTRAVLAADHGHVLMDEVLPGDRVEEPAGTWLKSKRRCRIGTMRTSSSAVLALSTAHVGLDAPVPDFVVPRGFKVFTDGPGYFHEGLSLQECLIPVITLNLRQVQPATTARGRVVLSYRRDKFTSLRFAVNARYEGAGQDTIAVRIEVVDPSSRQAKIVGEALDSDVTDALTRATTLRSGADVPVAVEVESSFEGDAVEIRARDAASGSVLHSIRLKNGIIG